MIGGDVIRCNYPRPKNKRTCFTIMNTDVVYISKSKVDETLAQSPKQGKKLLEPIKSIAAQTNSPLKIIELDHHTNVPEVHTYLDDLWCCIEGEVRFFVGGTMIEPRTRVAPDGTLDETEMRAKGLEGAEEIVMKPGDWLWIPSGMPHRHITDKIARLFIIKIPHY